MCRSYLAIQTTRLTLLLQLTGGRCKWNHNLETKLSFVGLDDYAMDWALEDKASDGIRAFFFYMWQW